MATPNAGDPPRHAHVPMDLDDSSPPSGSSSSTQGRHLGVPPATTCPWQTARFHGIECSRYFDCPSHIVERALSDTEEESRGGQETVQATLNRLSALVELGSAETPGAHSASQAAGSNAAGLTTRTETQSGNTEATGSASGNAAAGVHASPVSGLPRIGGGAVSTPQALNMSAAGAAAATRLVSRPSQALSTATEPSRPSEVVLPRWQPDSEVTYCPICGTQFSIFVRKHHCRKCGRVVCNSCSPHRITLPSQYIVRPPGAPRSLPEDVSLALLDGEWYPEFGSGERVRLCNPCVPDPNTAPPQTREGGPSSQNNLNPAVEADTSPLSNRWSFYFGGGAASGAQSRSRSVTMQPGPSSSSRPALPPPRSNEARILWGTPPAYSSTSQAPRLPPIRHPHYRTLTETGNRPGPSSGAVPHTSSSHTWNFHAPVPPRPQIAEEDECPVCHRELPPRTLPNFEALREAHITSCIASHSRYGGGGGPSSGGDGDTDDPDALPDALDSPPPRLTGMFPYAATEKDCVDSAECSICLEEFEVGVAMARLECLCRFHRACINAWWQRHPGRCPMHQHDGYGF